MWGASPDPSGYPPGFWLPERVRVRRELAAIAVDMAMTIRKAEVPELLANAATPIQTE